MVNLLQNKINSNLAITKLQNTLADLSTRLKNGSVTTIATAINETLNKFSEFFLELPNAEFNPELLTTNDTPRSELYNNNLQSIYNDIKRFYDDLKNLNEIQISSYNFAQVLTEELISRADSLASTVLDLNILNNFSRGDVIVAGDDFKDYKFIDSNVGLASSQAELLYGGNGLALAKTSAFNLINSSTEIEVLPISPLTSPENISGSPGNFERFYEGNYYNYLGLARPEAGEFKFRYIIAGTGISDVTTVYTNSDEQGITGAYVEIGATTEQKKENRKKMLDGNPSTFWECEYVYQVPDLLEIGLPVTGSPDSPEVQNGQEVVIDLEEAEQNARTYDEVGRDLVVDLIITLKAQATINTVKIDPVIFGTAAFPEILDISTASEENGEFVTVENWNTLRFARTLTPEANEFLTTSQLGATLAPNRGAYRGQGIFAFPQRTAKKIKIRIKMADPVPCPYERIYVLLKNDIEITTTIKTTTKKGPLNF
jgi:hypothetical protein